MNQQANVPFYKAPIKELNFHYHQSYFQHWKVRIWLTEDFHAQLGRTYFIITTLPF